MALYRCYLITVSDHIAEILETEAETDAEAMERARAAVAGQPGRTAELWQLSRLERIPFMLKHIPASATRPMPGRVSMILTPLWAVWPASDGALPARADGVASSRAANARVPK
jgi:hypothetical protein